MKLRPDTAEPDPRFSHSDLHRGAKHPHCSKWPGDAAAAALGITPLRNSYTGVSGEGVKCFLLSPKTTAEAAAAYLIWE